MVEYNLFGMRIWFEDSDIRYVKILQQQSNAVNASIAQFQTWYKAQSNIADVIDNYDDFVLDSMRNNVFIPLFSSLKTYDIYHISEQEFWSEYICLSESYKALETVESQYLDILQAKGDMENYRAARKAYRSRWQGGGFGIEGAIEGAVKAAALNSVSGLGHSMVNAVGNMTTSIGASLSKSNLYHSSETKSILNSSVVADIKSSYTRFIKLLNNMYDGYVSTNFYPKQAETLLENAKKYPEKRKELILKALSVCPGKFEILAYITTLYKDERKTVAQMARDFNVDLTPVYEDLIEAEYTEEARKSEEKALQARQRIIKLMNQVQISESKTLDLLENDCLLRLCGDVASKNEEECDAICAKINAYKATEKNKKKFLDQLNERKKEIWTSEDCEIFNKAYLETDITDENDRKKTAEFIKKSCRTDASEKYLSALEGCTAKQLRSAERYQRGLIRALLFSLMWSPLLSAVANIFWLKTGGWITVGLFCASFALLYLVVYHSMSWSTLTIDETVLHPMIAGGQEPKKWWPLRLALIGIFTTLICYGLTCL